MAADRLVRCSSSARGFYTRDANGKLVDPVGEKAPAVGAPRIPAILLPFLDALYVLPFPGAVSAEGIRQKQGHREGVGPAATANEASESAAFGDFLAAQGDCGRAETEYLRAEFRALPDSSEVTSLTRWSRWKTAACFYRNEEWADAGARFEDILRTEPLSARESRLAATLAAASLFNEGRYEACRRRIDRWGLLVPAVSASTDDSTGIPLDGIDSPEVEHSAYIVSALCDMGCGRWKEASGTLEKMARAEQFSGNAPRGATEILASIARRGPSLPRRNSTLAAMLSALVPGSGQVYAGRVGDGLRHFIVDGLLIYGVSHLIRDQEYWGAYLVAGIALPFYAGNVMGAHAAAGNYNRRKAVALLDTELQRLEYP